jgi:hypothetical protein
MKMRWLTGWVAMGLVLCGMARLWAGTVEAHRFAAYKEVTSVGSMPSELAKFLIDPEVYATAAEDYSNLRLAAENDREQPWLIRQRTVSRRAVRDIPYRARMVQLRELADNRVELVLMVETTNRIVFSGLRLQTGLRDFEKEVHVWAGPDGETWTPVAESAAIYDYSRFADVRRDRVVLTPNPGPWFRVEIGTGLAAQETPLLETTRQSRSGEFPIETERRTFQRIPFRMDQAELLESREESWTLKPVTTVTGLTHYAVSDLPKERETAIDFSGGRRPLIALELGFDEVNFARPVRVLARNRGESEWRPVTESTVHLIRIGSVQDSGLTIDFPGENRWDEYRVLIRNNDNPPLTLTGLSIHENCHEMLFLPRGNRYRLYYAGEGLTLPVYDIGQVLARADPELGQDWILGPEQVNPTYRQGPTRGWLAQHLRILMIGAMVLMVAALLAGLGFASRRLSALPKEGDSPGGRND